MRIDGIAEGGARRRLHRSRSPDFLESSRRVANLPVVGRARSLPAKTSSLGRVDNAINTDGDAIVLTCALPRHSTIEDVAHYVPRGPFERRTTSSASGCLDDEEVAG